MVKNKNAPIISTKTLLIIVVISLFVSVFYTRTEQYSYQENFTFFMPEDAGDNGTVTEKQYGFPLVYKDKTTYVPENGTGGSAYSIEEQGMSVPYIIMNTVLLTSVVYTSLSLYKQYRKK